ncbi:MAG: DNA polymerase III subunit delta [Candidatus Wildermuthbacteria bacterium]|nr:DNA polymerase III subunit delta [Candidatus Wildermuthbacteria bacterium]
MLIVLYGEDTYSLKKKLRAVVLRYRQLYPSGLSMREWDSQSEDATEIKEAIEARSLFGEKKLLIAKNLISHKGLLEYIEPRLGLLGKDSDVILVFVEEGNIEKNETFEKVRSMAAMAQEFPPLKESAVKTWLHKECQKYGLKMTPSGEAALSREVRGNLWRLEQEVRKLAAFSLPSKSVSEKDIKALVHFAFDPNIFQTLEAMLGGNKKNALVLLKEHEQQGESPFYIFSMLVSQCRKMLSLKDLYDKKYSLQEIARKSKMHPYALKKALELASKFSLADLKNLYGRLFKTDAEIKLGKVEPSQALEQLVLYS